MTTQIITRIAPSTFKVEIPSIKKTVILDFNDLVNEHKKLSDKPAVFEHWIPFSQMWGYYDSYTDSYHGQLPGDVKVSPKINGNDISITQVLRRNANHRPTASKTYINCKVEMLDGILNIKKVA